MTTPRWILLPPALSTRLHQQPPRDVLTSELSYEVLKMMRVDPLRADRLTRLARSIWNHLRAERPGWGPWPASIFDALYIGMIIGSWIEMEAESLILELSKEELAFIEDCCCQAGISFEQYLIRALIYRVEHQS